jgi:Protein of unknown function (DUF3800)
MTSPENMKVRACCDCSGKTENGSPFLTLAAYFGSEQSWEPLETQWSATLKNHNAPYFHARETMSLRGAYKEWDLGRVRRLVGELFNIIGQMDRADFFGTSCTVDLAEYRKAKVGIPPLRMPEQMCLDYCMATIFRHPKRNNGIELFFDRGEPFQPVMQRLWQRRAPKRIWWAHKVTRIDPVEMRTSPPLQSADLLAWFSNRYWSKGHNDVWGGLYAGTFLLTSHHHAFLDSPAISSIYNSSGAMRPGAQIDAPSIRFPEV